MSNFNFYEIYGLVIKSDIRLYDSILINNCSENYDVEILIGTIDSSHKDIYTTVGIFNFTNNYVSFHVDNIGSYEITNGNKIVVDPDDNCDIEDLKKFIIGSSLGLLLFQRNIIALHGGSLTIDNQSIIISGSIGAGKSTTIASLINKGYGFLTDDVSSITKNYNNEYVVNHCIPHQKLCKSTADMFGYDIDNLYKIDKTKNKYFTPKLDNFVKTPQKLKALFYLTVSDDDTVTYKEVLGAEKFNIILSNIFRKEFIPNNLFKTEYIKECLSLSKNISIYRISRPHGKNSINEVISTIENLTKGAEYNDHLSRVL